MPILHRKLDKKPLWCEDDQLSTDNSTFKHIPVNFKQQDSGVLTTVSTDDKASEDHHFKGAAELG